MMMVRCFCTEIDHQATRRSCKQRQQKAMRSQAYLLERQVCLLLLWREN